MMARSPTSSNQRPDTLMQDRSSPTRRKPLATHGRTIHWVNCVDFAMSATGPLTPQLLPIWCGAANRRNVPIGDILPIPATPAATTSTALTCQRRSRPQRHKRTQNVRVAALIRQPSLAQGLAEVLEIPLITIGHRASPVALQVLQPPAGKDRHIGLRPPKERL